MREGTITKPLLLLVLLAFSIVGLCDEEYAPEIRGRPTWGLVPGSAFPVQIIEKNGLAILDGDIILGPIDKLEISKVLYDELRARFNASLPGGNLRFQPQRRWLGATVPFAIAPTLPNTSRIYQAIDYMQTNTPLRFVPWSNNNYPDYVYFTPDSGTTCSSSVGRVGGRQTVLLASRCTAMITVHEILHAVGMYHEQSRIDRNSFVNIIWENIQTDKYHNFEMFDSRYSRDFQNYDYGSIMHYSQSSFPITPGLVTIEAPQPIGQRGSMSVQDIATIKYFYTKSDVILQSEALTSWKITSIPVAPGQGFAQGALLFEAAAIDITAVMTYRAPAPGVVSKIVSAVGSEVKNNAAILETFPV